jgi:hypothetical protein
MASQMSSQVQEGASSCDKDLFILESRQPNHRHKNVILMVVKQRLNANER